jgi:hypothetical protein
VEFGAPHRVGLPVYFRFENFKIQTLTTPMALPGFGWD